MKKEKTIKIVIFVVMVVCLLISLWLNLVDIMNGTRDARTIIPAILAGMAIVVSPFEFGRVIRLPMGEEWKGRKRFLILVAVILAFRFLPFLLHPDENLPPMPECWLMSFILYPPQKKGEGSKATPSEQATAESCEVSGQSVGPGVST